MSFLDMFRSPGRKLTSTELADLIPPIEGETPIDRMVRAQREAAQARVEELEQWLAEAIPLFLDFIESYVRDGLRDVSLTHLIGTVGAPKDFDSAEVSKAVMQELGQMGFKFFKSDTRYPYSIGVLPPKSRTLIDLDFNLSEGGSP